ncbi:MAG: hypothetical protein D4R67_02710 [Bacteroidetes bacterium]|nr:MAG: hypothetical protein D4R67_02710 [Bacteroidota bacterium]
MSRWILIGLMLITTGLSALGQRSHLSKRITISCSSVPLHRVLDEIARAGNFSFSYNADLIDADSLVTLHAESDKVESILESLLGERIRNKEVGNHVILMQSFTHEEKRESRQKTEYLVSGYVQDGRTGHRLMDATVYEVFRRQSVLSDAHGQYAFHLPVGPDIQGLYFAKSGYADTVIFIRPVQDYSMNVPLKPVYGDILRVSSRPAELPVNLIDSMALVNLLVPRKALITSENLQIYGTRGFQISLIPYVGTNWMNKGSYTNAISFNLLAGYTGGVNGFELGGLINIVRRNVRGLQIGGLGNIVGRHTMGVQIGGLFNVNLGHYTGLQLSGLLNYQRDTLTGTQIGGLCNYLEGKMQGVQVGGLANITTGHIDGWQIAGLANVASKDVSQVQIAGLVNYGRHVYGIQIGGLVNIANGNVNGLQIGGLFNFARSVVGLQLGAVNVSTSLETGVPIGFFSYVHKGGLHRFELYADEVFYGNVAFKSGTNRFYNIFQIGVGTSWMVNYMYGIGTAFIFSPKLSLDINIISGLVFSTTPSLALHGTLTKFLPALEYRFGKHLAIFGGPAYNLYAFDETRTFRPDGIAPYTFYDVVKGYQRIQMWIGGTVGVRF